MRTTIYYLSIFMIILSSCNRKQQPLGEAGSINLKYIEEALENALASSDTTRQKTEQGADAWTEHIEILGQMKRKLGNSTIHIGDTQADPGPLSLYENQLVEDINNGVQEIQEIQSKSNDIHAALLALQSQLKSYQDFFAEVNSGDHNYSHREIRAMKKSFKWKQVEFLENIQRLNTKLNGLHVRLEAIREGREYNLMQIKVYYGNFKEERAFTLMEIWEASAYFEKGYYELHHPGTDWSPAEISRIANEINSQFAMYKNEDDIPAEYLKVIINVEGYSDLTPFTDKGKLEFEELFASRLPKNYSRLSYDNQCRILDHCLSELRAKRLGMKLKEAIEAPARIEVHADNFYGKCYELPFHKTYHRRDKKRRMAKAFCYIILDHASPSEVSSSE